MKVILSGSMVLIKIYTNPDDPISLIQSIAKPKKIQHNYTTGIQFHPEVMNVKRLSGLFLQAKLIPPLFYYRFLSGLVGAFPGTPFHRCSYCHLRHSSSFSIGIAPVATTTRRLLTTMSAEDNEEATGTAPSPRRSSRSKKKVVEDEATLPTTGASSPSLTRKASKKKTTKKKTPTKKDSDTDSKDDSKPKRKTKKTATSVLTKQPKKTTASPSPKRKAAQKSDTEDEKVDKPTAKKAKKAPSHQVLTERDDIPKLWDATKAPETSYSKYRMDG